MNPSEEKGVDFINLLNVVSSENYPDVVHPGEAGTSADG